MFIGNAGDGTLYLRVYEALRSGILEGRYGPGARLPSTRALAAENGVSRTTVLKAYDQLMAEGYVTGRRGSGTYVADELPAPGVAAARDETLDRSAPSAPPLSVYGERVVAAGVKAPRSWQPVHYDFRYGLPPVEEFPHEIWRRIIARRVRRASLRSLQYGEPGGYPPLREAIADYLRRSRAVRCSAEQVVIVNGSQQALDLSARLLLDRGDAVVIEEPSYQGARLVFQAAQATVVPVRVDGEGIDISSASTDDVNVKLAYVTPSHQFPTGAVMTVARRLALLTWAERRGAFVLEDDYDSEFRYDARPVESLQGLDQHGRVVYTGTFSKVLFPALRIGYMVLPEPLLEPFLAAKWLADRHSPALEQEALADFIAEGHFERHLRRSRTRNGARRAALLEALAEHFGDRVRIEGSNAGIHVMVWFDDDASADLGAVVERAAAAKIGIYPVTPYFIDPPDRAGLIMGYASLTERQIRDGVRLLAEVIGNG